MAEISKSMLLAVVKFRAGQYEKAFERLESEGSEESGEMYRAKLVLERLYNEVENGMFDK